MSFDRIGRCIAVGYSGGRDSTALLHAVAAIAPRLGLDVLALHVHHGLSRFAQQWEAHCRDTCSAWAAAGAPLRFVSARLGAGPPRGQSVEAWARQERYRRLADMAIDHGATIVLLAHHRRDQAETLLLQALRGAGPDGLSAMPAVRRTGAVRFVRPWLERGDEDIADYVSRHGLRWVEDDSNGDPRFARNRLRLRVWPALTAAFPSAETSLSQAAEWSRQASALMREIGAADVERFSAGRDRSGRPRLRIEGWASLSPARRANVLRAWWRQCSGVPAPAQAVRRWMQELAGPGSARWLLPAGAAVRYRGVLSFVPDDEPRPAVELAPEPVGVVLPVVPAMALEGPDPEPRSALRRQHVPRLDASSSPPVPGDLAFPILRVGAHSVPGWHGRLEVFALDEGGVPLRLLAIARLCPRRGGERFSFGPGRPARSLKKQYQALDIDAWSRQGPLVYAGERLLFVPGLGLEANALREAGEPRVGLRWHADPSPAGEGGRRR